MLKIGDAVRALSAFVWELRGKPGSCSGLNGDSYDHDLESPLLIEVSREAVVDALMRKDARYGHLRDELLAKGVAPFHVLPSKWEEVSPKAA